MLLLIIFLITFFVIFAIRLRFFYGVFKSHKCLVGKTALVTGGNRGIGYETALVLASRGCRVIIAARNDAEKIKQKIIEITNNTNIITKRFDLSSYKSIRAFAKDILETEERLDILINNAGVAHIDKSYSEDNNVNIMQINHLGPFLLTHLLIDLLKKSAPSRIVFLSSWTAFTNNLVIHNVNKLQEKTMFAYGNTKLCNIITATILGERLKKYNITVNSVHPGIIHTNIFDYSKNLPLFDTSKLTFLISSIPFFSKTPEEGAHCSLHVALSDTCENITGKLFSDCKVFWMPNKVSDDNFCKKIFEITEELTNLQEHEKIVK